MACEDTRHTRVLLERYGVSASLVSYHEHNERARAAELVERMLGGDVVALVSDAGMPLVSDPGFPLVQGCVAAGLAVEVLPGPSAALTALVASGLPSDVWRFVGFLPRKRSGWTRVFAAPETVVAFESPRRVGASLAVLAELDPDRPVAVCRELTKLHEEIVRGFASELAARYAVRRTRGARSSSSSAARLSARASTPPPSRRCAPWSSRARVRRPRPRSWRSSRALRPTRSIGRWRHEGAGGRRRRDRRDHRRGDGRGRDRARRQRGPRRRAARPRPGRSTTRRRCR